MQSQTDELLCNKLAGYRANFACDPEYSRGRLYEENESPTRSAFRRDCDRIIHSVAFRRLEYKTQVFVNHEGDHYRTRLTHSLEVAQITRGICRNIGLDEDLGEALALAHDLGHTPFGHAGEDVLDEANAAYGGFSHNAQTLKILTQLEHKYADFDGLNLTWETLEGVAKHNGPMVGSNRDTKRYDGSLPKVVESYNKLHDLGLDSFASAEAQVSSLADDIAYNNHDIDDGLRAGLFEIADLKELPFVGDNFKEIERKYPGLERSRWIHEAVRHMISVMVADVTKNTLATIQSEGISSVDAIRGLGRPLVAFSPDIEEAHHSLKAFLMEHMYRHYKVCRMTTKARQILREMYDHLFTNPDCLPVEWQDGDLGSNNALRAERVTDFIAGMTDRFAIEEHARLFRM